MLKNSDSWFSRFSSILRHKDYSAHEVEINYFSLVFILDFMLCPIGVFYE